jgi:hypothetical protein
VRSTPNTAVGVELIARHVPSQAPGNVSHDLLLFVRLRFCTAATYHILIPPLSSLTRITAYTLPSFTLTVRPTVERSHTCVSVVDCYATCRPERGKRMTQTVRNPTRMTTTVRDPSPITPTVRDPSPMTPTVRDPSPMTTTVRDPTPVTPTVRDPSPMTTTNSPRSHSHDHNSLRSQFSLP